MLENVPNGLQVNPQVIMDEDVAEGGNTTPRDGRVRVRSCWGEALGGLRQRLQIPQDSILQGMGPHELCPPSCTIRFDAPDALQHVAQRDDILFHRGTASRRTRSRRAGWSARSVTTST